MIKTRHVGTNLVALKAGFHGSDVFFVIYNKLFSWGGVIKQRHTGGWSDKGSLKKKTCAALWSHDFLKII